MKQTIGNACGTIGVLHALANNLSTVSIGEAVPLDLNTLAQAYLRTSWLLTFADGFPAARGSMTSSVASIMTTSVSDALQLTPDQNTA